MKQITDDHESNAEIIERIIGKKMIPIYMINGGMALTVISIFVAIAWPIRDTVSTLQVDVCQCVKSDEAYRNFLPKDFYHRLQKDSHIADIKAIQNPKDADSIYKDQNITEAERLDIRYRGTE